jgi:hypothetical protein
MTKVCTARKQLSPLHLQPVMLPHLSLRQCLHHLHFRMKDTRIGVMVLRHPVRSEPLLAPRMWASLAAPQKLVLANSRSSQSRVAGSVTQQGHL